MNSTLLAISLVGPILGCLELPHQALANPIGAHNDQQQEAALDRITVGTDRAPDNANDLSHSLKPARTLSPSRRLQPARTLSPSRRLQPARTHEGRKRSLRLSTSRGSARIPFSRMGVPADARASGEEKSRRLKPAARGRGSIGRVKPAARVVVNVRAYVEHATDGDPAGSWRASGRSQSDNQPDDGQTQHGKKLGERLIRQAHGDADEDVMDTILRLMSSAAQRLEIELDAGEETQAVQRQIMDQLDAAIKIAGVRRRVRSRDQEPTPG